MTDRSTEYGRLKSDDNLDYDRLGYWRDKAEGLACDLDSAVEVMAARVWGGKDVASMGEWLLRNYRHHKAVKAGVGDTLRALSTATRNPEKE